MSSVAEVIAELNRVLETSVEIGRHLQTASDAVDEAVLILRQALTGTGDGESEQLIALFAGIQDELAHQAGIVGAASAAVAATIDRLRGDESNPAPDLSTVPRSIPHPATTDQANHVGITRDAAWAARRIAQLPAYIRRTHAVAYDADGNEHHLVSGRDDYSARAQVALRNSEHFPPPRREGWYGITDHVETKLAMLMRERGITTATVVINNPKGVCRGEMGCRSAVKSLLPNGYVMMVWEPGELEPVTLEGKARP